MGLFYFRWRLYPEESAFYSTVSIPVDGAFLFQVWDLDDLPFWSQGVSIPVDGAFLFQASQE